ncbi:hypothetical protein CCDG5_1136 [[Clostridium] cellulosi]|jgi:conserved hypothetical protein TIGR00252|uniref:UPF0102 protein CCDG5_1136 n=1 Tax=[Clostridium] cellulosi TaxID=29343 RepID=A0A078KP63_9FIRM|nr:MAG: YraN family protein [[Clostridium] cellulosi]CDZ24253.1 hypothetical protein CCDG5_1136 [[Clostridium] cellulosi]
MGRNSSGKIGEDAAAEFLTDKGWNIIERNYHTRQGEIDIIATFGGYIIFVEVKTRLENSLFLPREAVDQKKQAKLIQAALMYISSHEIGLLQPRFDVIEVIASKNKEIKQINLIENAFGL